MGKQQETLECPNCGGGVYFQETEFKQYRKQAYSSNIGGELFAVTVDGPRVRVCLCGHPVPIATRAVQQKDRESFAESLEKALHYRKMLHPTWLQDRMLKVYARKQDASELNHKLAHLLEIVNGPDYLDSRPAVNSQSKKKQAPAERKSGRGPAIPQSKQKKP